MKRFFTIAAFAALLASCANADKNAYQIAGAASWEGLEDGSQVVLLDMTTRDTLGVGPIKEGKFDIKGSADSARLVLAMADRRHVAQFILEPGVINVDLTNGACTGTPLNDALEAVSNSMQQAETEEDYKKAALEGYKQNENNLIAQLLWGNLVYDLTYDEMVTLLETAQPIIKNDPKNERQLKAKQAELATAPGTKYVDIEGITLDGEPIKLSDILKQGKPVVVDFWASWCGPCRREISESLSVYAPEYKKKVNFVGVAVWEEKIEDTQKAVNNLPITWPIIYAGDRQNSPTEAYGIMGIPHIMIIGRDGTILARNLRGAAIEEAILDALKK